MRAEWVGCRPGSAQALRLAMISALVLLYSKGALVALTVMLSARDTFSPCFEVRDGSSDLSMLAVIFVALHTPIHGFDGLMLLLLMVEEDVARVGRHERRARASNSDGSGVRLIEI